MNIKSKIRVALLEFEDKKPMSGTDQKVLDFILGESINEAGSLDAINRFISVINSKQRKFITAAVMTALLASPTFTYALEHATDEDKAIVTQFMGHSGVETGHEINSDSKAEFAINLTNSFESGKYEVNQAEVMGKLNSLKDFLSKHTNTKYRIKITASESQVPNQNGLKTGQLAKMRSNVMEKIVNEYLKGNNIDVSIEKATNVGDVPWDGHNKDDRKYTKDQFVKLEVFLEGENGSAPCEISFDKDDGSSSSEKHGFISFEQKLGQSGTMTITPGSIPDRMVITKDGNVVADTGYFVDKAHSYGEWNLVPLYVAELTEIANRNSGMAAVSGLKDVKSFNSFDELIGSLVKKKYDYSKDSRNEIKNGILKLKQLWDSGQREFVLYSMKKGTLDYNVSHGDDAKVTVYSPIGKTGFGIHGNCK